MKCKWKYNCCIFFKQNIFCFESTNIIQAPLLKQGIIPEIKKKNNNLFGYSVVKLSDSIHPAVNATPFNAKSKTSRMNGREHQCTGKCLAVPHCSGVLRWWWLVVVLGLSCTVSRGAAKYPHDNRHHQHHDKRQNESG